MSHGLIHQTLVSAVPAAIPLLYAGLGELLNERVGVINIGIEGVMLMGAVAGFAVTSHDANVALGILAGAGTGAAFSLLLIGIPSVLIGIPWILAGFATWFIGQGLSSQLGTSYIGQSLSVHPAQINVPLLDRLPFFGDIFFRQTWPFYLALALVAVVALLLSRTRHGLNLRAVGEDPAAAYAAGVSVRKIQMSYVALGGALMGAGGAIFSVVIAGSFQPGMTAGRGFIALALVIFVGARPVALVGAAYLFGICLILVDVGQSQGWGVSPYFLSMTPYLLTVVALAVRTLRERRKRANPGEQVFPGARLLRVKRRLRAQPTDATESVALE